MGYCWNSATSVWLNYYFRKENVQRNIEGIQQEFIKYQLKIVKLNECLFSIFKKKKGLCSTIPILP